MTEPAELFARLTPELEDMHGLTIEGQRAEQPLEVNVALVFSIRKGLHRCDAILGEIESAD